MRVLSYPKVNLALDILRKDESGYHEIRTVLHELSAPEYSNFHDELIFEPREDGEIIVESSNPKLPCDKTNTVLKAAFLLQKYAGIRKGAKIFIRKRIPLMSGLGGGASNAVAALKGLAELWGIECCTSLRGGQQGRRSNLAGLLRFARNDVHTSDCFISQLAFQIGTDCAFFWHGGTAVGEHFGEKITPLPPLPRGIKFEIIDTGVEVSSKWAYENIDLKKCGKNIDKTEKMIAAIRTGDAKKIIENIHNDFEEGGKDTILLCGSGGALVKIGYS